MSRKIKLNRSLIKEWLGDLGESEWTQKTKQGMLILQNNFDYDAYLRLFNGEHIHISSDYDLELVMSEIEHWKGWK